VTTAQRVVLFLLGASLLAGIVWGSPFYYRLAYLWIFLFFSSLLLSRAALRGLRIKRIARTQRSQVGNVFEERFEILNESAFPHLWVEIRDESPLPGTRGSQVLSLIRGHESRTYLIRTRLLERGVFPLGSTVLASGDLFGLFPTRLDFAAEESLLVYPMMVEVRSFSNPPGWLSGGEALRRRTHQITPNASGVRDYAPGDPLNRIHWASTARRNRLMVKEFELDPLAEVWIFLDASKSAQAMLPYQAPVLDERDMWRPSVKIPLPASTEEYAVSIAASLARYYIRKGRSVGLVCAGHLLSLLPSDRGPRQLGKILEALALVRAEGRLPLQALVEAQVQNLPRGSTVILITPAGGDRIVFTVEVLMRRGMRPVVILLDGKTFGGPTSATVAADKLAAIKVPVCKIENGDDLSTVLSAAGKAQMWQ
jgi:uncharacterized protein (DUF58 family)